MFKTFYDDLTYLPRRKFNAKYTLPFLIFFLTLVLLGQFMTMLVPLSQLNKASGRIVDMETEIDSWSHNRTTQRNTPNYALAITLDNMHSYKIQESVYRTKLGSTLKNGDYVTIYYPTLTLKILSSDMARDVSQVERNNKILYGWKEQQQGVWLIIGLLIGAIAFFYWMKGYLRDYVDSTTLR